MKRLAVNSGTAFTLKGVMATVKTETDRFREALKHSIGKLELAGEKNVQTRIAKFAGYTPSYINGVLKGHKPGSEELRESVANFFGTSYEQMLSLGRHLLSGGDIETFTNRVAESNDPTLNDIINKWGSLSENQKQEYRDKILASSADWPMRKEFEAGEFSETNNIEEIADRIFYEACAAVRYQPLRDNSVRLPFSIDYIEGRISEKELWDESQFYARERGLIELKSLDLNGPKENARRADQARRMKAQDRVQENMRSEEGKKRLSKETKKKK